MRTVSGRSDRAYTCHDFRRRFADKIDVVERADHLETFGEEMPDPVSAQPQRGVTTFFVMSELPRWKICDGCARDAVGSGGVRERQGPAGRQSHRDRPEAPNRQHLAYISL
jgi:hypothetical protein